MLRPMGVFLLEEQIWEELAFKWYPLVLQAKAMYLGMSSGKRWLLLKPAPTSELSPTAISTSLNATLCRRCWSSTQRFPTTSQEICCWLTTCERGWVTYPSLWWLHYEGNVYDSQHSDLYYQDRNTGINTGLHGDNMTCITSCESLKCVRWLNYSWGIADSATNNGITIVRNNRP